MALPSGLALTPAQFPLQGPPALGFINTRNNEVPWQSAGLPGLGTQRVTYDDRLVTTKQSHDWCHHAYACMLRGRQGEPSPALFRNTFLFAEREPARSGLAREMVSLVNLFELNRRLRTEPYREKFQKKDWTPLDDFRPLGFQVTHTEALPIQQKFEGTEVVVATSHRAFAFNIWLHQNQPMKKGDHLWFLMVPQDGHWQFVPYVSGDSTPPSRAFLSNYERSGKAIYVGRVHEFYDDPGTARVHWLHASSGCKQFVGTARAALAEGTTPNSYKDELVKLPELVVFYGLQ